MSQQQPQNPMAPPPAMTGFTVTDGFSVIPPKRPVAVTAAGWLMFAVAALSAIAAFVFVIVDVIHITNIFELFTHQGFWRGVPLFAAAVATAVLAMLVRNANSGAQIATFALLGAAAVYFLSAGIGDIAQVPFTGEADTQGPMLLFALILLAVAVLVAVPVVLLAGPAAAWWFRERRQEVTFIDRPETPTRPAVFVVAVAFAGLTGLLEIANIAVYAGWMSTQGVDFAGAEAVFAGFFVTVAIPVLLLLAVTVGLAFGNDLVRVAAYGVCGYYCYNGLSAVVGFLLIDDPTVGFNWVFYLDIGLAVITAITAAVALFGLSQKQLLRWFDARQEPQPVPAPTAPPTGQE